MLSPRIAGVDLHIKCGRGLLQTPLTSVFGGWSDKLHCQVGLQVKIHMLIMAAGCHTVQVRLPNLTLLLVFVQLLTVRCLYERDRWSA